MNIRSSEHKCYIPKADAGDYISKFAELNIALVICAAGMYMTVQANIGLAPWLALSVGFQNLTGINYGIWNNIIGAAVIAADIILREKIGFGTVGDCLLIGTYISMLDYFRAFPPMENVFAGIIVMLAGIVIQDIGCYMILDSAFGAGPRDALMVALARRIKGLSAGHVRIIMEGCVLVLGWLMGADIGVGTVIYVVGFGFILDLVFRFFRFDVKRARNENFLETVDNLAALRKAIKHK
ncbi:MAG: hypothetical protein LKJ83_01630 [Eubacteriaceae bacterium]|jgi:uncharacterized membrane protein YczE|nr:hypothetical protein [Eubacteriaceae bacterium]